VSKTLIGIVSFGNQPFTKLTVDSIRETTKSDIDFFIIVGKPGDSETINWLSTEPEIKFKIHTVNMGFPYSINDIYDFAWKENNYDNLIIAGNDIAAYPHSVDSLVTLADISTYEVISASQVDVRAFVSAYPEARKYFNGDKQIFSDFKSKPWDLFKDYSPILDIGHMQLLDIQNLCLYKKTVFDRVGYTDVNYYPCYFIDNDYANRLVKSNAKVCSLSNAKFFHFWSRTIHQGSGGSTSKAFENNKEYYREKWGGDVGQETKTPPIKIESRDGEVNIINQWRNKT
jgi:GT2 family glycosyltransferase